MFDAYKDIFNQRGASYHKAMVLYPKAREEEFRQIIDLADLRDGQVVCDMPSGGGYMDGFIEQAVELICVETSAAFLENCPESPRMRKLLCDLHDTPLESASADRVISLAGLHHVSDKKGFFTEAHRLLKPGGRFCIADAQAGSRIARFLDGFVSDHNSMGHHGEYLDARARDDLRACGFEIETDQPIPYHWNFTSPEAMADCCRLMFGMDKADAETVRKGIETHLGCTTDNGRTRMNWELTFLACRRP